MAMNAVGIVAIVLLVAVAIAGIKLLGKMRQAHGGEVPQEKGCSSNHSCSGCCGGTSCFSNKSKEAPLVVYFEDEELDRFRRRSGKDYTEAELAEWNDVLHTLNPKEVTAWQRSIELRKLPIPDDIQRQLTALTAQ